MAGTVKVGVVRRDRGGVICDRRSPLGNPFEMRGEQTRNAVCDAHQEYTDKVLYEGVLPCKAIEDLASPEAPKAKGFTPPERNGFVQKFGSLVDRVRNGEDLLLKCHCYGKRCHCDYYKTLIEEQLKEEKR